MSVPAPSALPLVSTADLLGDVPVSENPLGDILKRCNWLFETYTPMTLAFTPWSDQTQDTATFVVPVTPSADALNYQPLLVLIADTVGNVSVDIDTSTDASSWSTAGAWSGNLLAISAVDDAHVFWSEASFPIPASANYLRITVAHADTGAQMQLAAFAIYPAPLEIGSTPTVTTLDAVLSSGWGSSGFRMYEDAHLTSTGAALHTEYFDRIVRNVSALAADRVHCLGAFVQDSRIDLTFTTTGLDTRYAYYGRPYMPGNEGRASTVTVKVKYSDTSSPSGSLTVGQVDGPSGSTHTFSPSSSHQTATITVAGSRPTLAAKVTAAGRGDLEYIVFEWTPPVADDYVPTGSDEIIVEAAPPPERVLLGIVNDLTMRLAAYTYSVNAPVFDADDYVDSDFDAGGSVFSSEAVAYAFQRCPPGVYGMEGTFVRCSNGGSGKMNKAKVASQVTSGGSIMVVQTESTISGTHRALWDSDAAPPVTDEAGKEYASSGNGDIPFRVTGDDEGQNMLLACRHCVGVSGQWLEVEDLSGVV